MKPSELEFETGYATHPGKVRTVNEDNYFIGPNHGLWLVADGMGGHKNGKLASSIVVDSAKSLGRATSAPDLLKQFNESIYRANAQLLSLSNGEDSVIGSTIAALLVFGGHFACVWSGDSRIYLVRSRAISQLSRDHTEVQELLDRGVIQPSEAKSWPRRNVVTKAIGVFDEPDVEAVQGDLHVGDSFILCSDGLTGHVDDQEILQKVLNVSAQTACDSLIKLTLERGARDNVTVIVLNIRRKDGTIARRPGYS